MNGRDLLSGAKAGAQFGIVVAGIAVFIRVAGGPEGWARKVHMPFAGTVVVALFGWLFAGIIVGALYGLTRRVLGAALVGFCAALPMSFGYKILLSGGKPWSGIDWIFVPIYALLFGGGLGVMFYYQFAGRRKQLEARRNGGGGTDQSSKL